MAGERVEGIDYHRDGRGHFWPGPDPCRPPTQKPEVHDRAGVQLIATSPIPIVSMVVFDGHLFVATAEGVFERDADGVFRECRFALADKPWEKPA